MVTKLMNSNGDKTRELKLWQNYLRPPVTLGLTWTNSTFCLPWTASYLLISCKRFDVCIVQGKTVFGIIETIVWFNIKRAYMFYQIFVWGFCHVSIKNVKSCFFLQTCIEKDVTVTPSLLSHLVMHFIFQLSFSTWKLKQSWWSDSFV